MLVYVCDFRSKDVYEYGSLACFTAVPQRAHEAVGFGSHKHP